MIGEQHVNLVDDAFDVPVQLPPGRHTLIIRCEEFAHRIDVTSGQDRPRITIQSPEPGRFIEASTETVVVKGKVESLFGVQTLMLGDTPIEVGPQGEFEHVYTPTYGMNHVQLTMTTVEGLTTDLTRSFIFGRFRPFKASGGPGVFARISPDGLNVMSDAIEKQLDDGVLEDAMEPYMKRHGDLQLHEFKYDDLEIETRPIQGGIRLRIAINDFRLKFTYHYKAFGFIGGRVRGWAKARPLRLEATISIQPDGTQGFSARMQDSRVELERFDLDLNDLYSVVEGLIQPMVKDMGKDAIKKAIDTVVLGQILRSELLNQDIDIMGKKATISLYVDKLSCSPSGIRLEGHSQVSALEAIHQAPGVLQLPNASAPEAGRDELEFAISAELYNYIFSEAWRAGLLDQDLTAVLAEGGTSLRTTLLAGFAGDGLLSEIGDAEIQIRTRALLPPVARMNPAVPGGLLLDFGGLVLQLSSPLPNGQVVTWAELTLSARRHDTHLGQWHHQDGTGRKS